MKKLQWSALSPWKKTLIIALGLVQVCLLLTALWDIGRRGEHEIRGRKWFWRAIAFINIVGPLTYFRFGRTSDKLVIGR